MVKRASIPVRADVLESVLELLRDGRARTTREIYAVILLRYRATSREAMVRAIAWLAFEGMIVMREGGRITLSSNTASLFALLSALDVPGKEHGQ